MSDKTVLIRVAVKQTVLNCRRKIRTGTAIDPGTSPGTGVPTTSPTRTTGTEYVATGSTATVRARTVHHRRVTLTRVLGGARAWARRRRRLGSSTKLRLTRGNVGTRLGGCVRRGRAALGTWSWRGYVVRRGLRRGTRSRRRRGRSRGWCGTAGGPCGTCISSVVFSGGTQIVTELPKSRAT